MAGSSLPKRAFVRCFRIVCWQFVNYRDQLLEINPIHDECPRICARLGRQAIGKDYCEGCDVRIAKQGFEEACEEFLDEEFDNDPFKWRDHYDLETLENTVIEIYCIKETDDSVWTLRTQALVNILNAEINKKDRIKHWDDKQKAKNRGRD